MTTTQATTENLPRTAILQLDGNYIQTITTVKQLDYAKTSARRWADKGQAVILRYVSDDQVKAIDAVIADREEHILRPARKLYDAATELFKVIQSWETYDRMHAAHKDFLTACGETYDFNAFEVA
jgi:hypothetical protein